MASLMKTGVGIRSELFAPVLEQRPNFGFLEAHSENYFGCSLARTKLLELRADYPISLHGVGLSLGRADDLNQHHLSQLKELIDEVEPLFISEHLSWSAYAHRHLPDLLPLPLTQNAFALMCQHIDQMQSALGCRILIENPSNYLLFDQIQIPEPEFLNELAARTGCGLLVDVNNIHVSAMNLGRDAVEYVDMLNSNVIEQYHLAGYVEVQREVDGRSETVLIDSHNQPVYPAVWGLFQHTLEVHGARPTLFEWDSDFPDFSVIVGECDKANELIVKCSNRHVADSVQNKPQETLNKEQSNLGSALAKHQSVFLDAVLNLGIGSLGTAFSQESAQIIEQHKHRIWVYQNNIFGAIQDYLAEVYPATRGVVGADFFKQMVQQFIQVKPPIDGNIHAYGEALSSVLLKYDALHDLPYLSDLMMYEWALHAAYFSCMDDLLNPKEIDQNELLTMGVTLNASTAIIQSVYPIYEIHRQSLPDYQGDVSIDLGQSKDTLLVYKQGHEVINRQLSDDEFLVLREIQKTDTIQESVEGLHELIAPESLSLVLAWVFEAQLLSKAVK